MNPYLEKFTSTRKTTSAVGGKKEGMEWNFVLGKGGGTNLSDKGLNLRGSWQQGHSAPYNTPSRI
jgi:hypothetical protein